MAELIDVIGYICTYYPFSEELSQARLTKMVYLADWKKAITCNTQMTNIEWIFNFYGPYVGDVVLTAQQDKRFKVMDTVNFYGSKKYIIKLFNTSDSTFPSLSKKDKEILDFVINKTSKKYWRDFINLVYSTYPIFTSERGAKLDLVNLAKKYNSEYDNSKLEL